MAMIVPAQDLACFNHSDLDEAISPTSDYLPNMHAPGIFFSQTGPADLYGHAWATESEGNQTLADYPDHGSTHPGEAEDYATYAFAHGHNTPRGQGQDSADGHRGKWSGAAVASAIGGEAMKRGTSRSSAGSHKHRASKHSSSKRGARLAPATSKRSSIEITGNAPAFREARQNHGPLDVSMYHLASSEVPTSHGYPPMFMDMTMAPDGLAYPPGMGLSVTPSQMHLDPETFEHSSSTSWDAFSAVDSRMSGSPPNEAAWSDSSFNSPSPVINSQSPSMHHGLGAQPVMSPEDLDGSFLTTIADDVSLPGSTGSRRQSHEGESARDHHLYKNAIAGPDGLYHCPWEGESSCNHKAEKLKCNYDKFVDSHLKPYRCKVESCLDARFSSTACLLRHEREAHAMHGHGDKPFLCTHAGCDRAQPGNGFPRQWNLKDHMRRVHNDNGGAAPMTAIAGSPPPSAAPALAPAAAAAAASQPSSSSKSTKGRKRKDAPETSSGRKASIKSMPVADSAKPRRSSSSTTHDQWTEHRTNLEDLVRGLQPGDARGHRRVLDVATAMEKMSQGFAASPKHEDTYRRHP